MIQALNPVNPYMQAPMQPNYNAVKIDVHNPSVSAPGYGYPQAAPQMMPAMAPQYTPQYAPVTAPYYAYPQAPQLYDYQQAQGQPHYMPQPMAVPSYTQPSAPAQAMTPAQAYAQPTAPAQAMTPAQAYIQPTAPAQAMTPAQAYAQPTAPAQPMVCPPCPPCPTPVAPAPQVAEMVAPVAVPQPQVIQQQNYNVPQPVITEAPAAATATATATATAPAQAPAVEVVPPAPLTPQVDLNGFIAKLSDPDFEVQANVMEEIANMVKDQPDMATELLDEKVINALTSVMSVDSNKLTGPTQEQITARQKLMSGQQLTDQEQQLAMTITPMEQAERNKSYSMFTTAILQKLYADEVQKLTGTKVPLTELPGAVSIVEHLKDNDNPMVRTSAIEALSYIQDPAYKQDLTTIFTVAKNDVDPNVQEAATAALAKLETT